MRSRILLSLALFLTILFVSNIAIAQSVTVSVPSTQPWTDTGIIVSEGDMISITSSGTVTWDSSNTPTGPNGTNNPSGTCGFVVTDSSVPAQALIGNIADSSNLDGNGFFVGSNFQGTVPITNTTTQTGTLFLGFNDGAVFCDRSGYDSHGFGGDNQGSFSATVTVSSFVEKIVFTSNSAGNNDIWMMNPDGAKLEQLTTDPASDSSPALSPDGTRIAFNSNRGGGEQNIYVLDLQTRNITQLTTDNSVSDSKPTWSPDSSEIAFGSYRGGYGAIWKIPASGGTATQVTFPTQPTPSEGDVSPYWSPDENHIVFQSTEGHRDLWAIWEVSLIDGTEHEIIEYFGNEYLPAYSPDGTRIAWTHCPSNSCTSSPYADIWVADADGSNRIQLTVNNYVDVDSDWSPDGTKIIFTRSNSTSSSIYVMNQDGSDIFSILDDGNGNYHPSWGVINTELISTSTTNSIGYSATVATGQNTFVQSSNGNFGLLLKGQTKTITNSVILNNTGDISAKVEARFNDSISGVFGLISGANLLNTTNFALGPSGSLVSLDNNGTDVQIAIAPQGVTALNARLGVPSEQVAGDYSGTVVLTFSNDV